MLVSLDGFTDNVLALPAFDWGGHRWSYNPLHPRHAPFYNGSGRVTYPHPLRLTIGEDTNPDEEIEMGMPVADWVVRGFQLAVDDGFWRAYLQRAHDHMERSAGLRSKGSAYTLAFPTPPSFLREAQAPGSRLLHRL